MSKRRVHKIRTEKKRLAGKRMWYVHCTCGSWFQWVFDKNECQPLADRHLERVRSS